MKCLTTILLLLQEKKMNYLPLLFQYKEILMPIELHAKLKYLKIDENEIFYVKN